MAINPAAVQAQAHNMLADIVAARGLSSSIVASSPHVRPLRYDPVLENLRNLSPSSDGTYLRDLTMEEVALIDNIVSRYGMTLVSGEESWYMRAANTSTILADLDLGATLPVKLRMSCPPPHRTHLEPYQPYPGLPTPVGEVALVLQCAAERLFYCFEKDTFDTVAPLCALYGVMLQEVGIFEGRTTFMVTIPLFLCPRVRCAEQLPGGHEGPLDTRTIQGQRCITSAIVQAGSSRLRVFLNGYGYTHEFKAGLDMWESMDNVTNASLMRVGDVPMSLTVESGVFYTDTLEDQLRGLYFTGVSNVHVLTRSYTAHFDTVLPWIKSIDADPSLFHSIRGLNRPVESCDAPEPFEVQETFRTMYEDYAGVEDFRRVPADTLVYRAIGTAPLYIHLFDHVVVIKWHKLNGKDSRVYAKGHVVGTWGAHEGEMQTFRVGEHGGHPKFLKPVQPFYRLVTKYKASMVEDLEHQEDFELFLIFMFTRGSTLDTMLDMSSYFASKIAKDVDLMTRFLLFVSSKGMATVPDLQPRLMQATLEQRYYYVRALIYKLPRGSFQNFLLVQ